MGTVTDFLYIVIGTILAGILVAVLMANKASSSGNTVLKNKPEKPAEPEALAKITVYAPDGKELKSYTADADSIDTDGQCLDFNTKEGKQVMLLAGSNLVEISYL